MNYYIDFVINKNCDLNCEYCTSRASICSPDPYDFEQFKKDISHFANLNIKFEATIIGGEPFCNKNIFKYIEYINSLNKNIPVNIFTNGLYLSKAKNNVWEKIKELKCNLWITIYNKSNINYNEIFNNCIKYGIKYSYNHYNYDRTFDLKKNPNYNFRGEMGIYKFCENNTDEYKSKVKIRECIKQNDEHLPLCIRAYNGILYFGACFSMLSNIDKVFNSKLESYLIENDDYIKIENIKSESDISVSNVKFCKNHCRYFGESEWKKSKKEKIEFFVEE